MTDKEKYRSRLVDFLTARGIEINTRKKPPVIRCPSPHHEDIHPSCCVYETNLHCPVCNLNWDIYKTCELLDGLTDFSQQIEEVARTLGDYQEPPKKKKRKSKKKNLVKLSLEKAREIFNEKDVLPIAKKMKWGNRIAGAWPYFDESGLVEIIDFRFEGFDKKAVISFWYDGQKMRMSGAPVCLYGRDQLSDVSRPVLIVEGAKCAHKALELVRFIPITWNGGTGRINQVDWSPLNGRDVYILPDDDTPGRKAAAVIQTKIPGSKIVPAIEKAREIKKHGADIVEFLKVMKPEELEEHILKKAVLPALPEKTNSNRPFRVFGVGDDGSGYYCDRHGRMLSLSLVAFGKNHLFNLAPMAWWRDKFADDQGRMTWDLAYEYLIQETGVVDFDPEKIRGRGAWREPDGRICFHDGVETIGEYDDQNRWYVKKSRRDFGLSSNPTPQETRNKMIEVMTRLSFETLADAYHLLCWSTLAPFAGALPWRSAILLTGASKSGKSTIIDHIVKPLALPEAFTGGESTEAGVRQFIRNDATAIVIEEADPDTKKKLFRREDLFSLMRQSTSDDAPRVAKGTRDGRGMSFTLRSMFLFAAISPEVESIADDNRITRVNLEKPKGLWQPIRNEIRGLFTRENCAGIRAATWAKLKQIIAVSDSDDLVPVIQEATDQDSRQSLSEALFIAAYLFVWCGQSKINPDEVATIAQAWRAQDIDTTDRDEARELIDRILDERIMIDSNKTFLTIRETLTAVQTRLKPNRIGEGIEELGFGEIVNLKNTVGRIGVTVLKGGEVAIAKNHHEVMKIIEKKKGYQRILRRHQKCIDHGRPVNMAGTTRNCVIFEGLLNLEEKAQGISGY